MNIHVRSNYIGEFSVISHIGVILLPRRPSNVRKGGNVRAFDVTKSYNYWLSKELRSAKITRDYTISLIFAFIQLSNFNLRYHSVHFPSYPIKSNDTVLILKKFPSIVIFVAVPIINHQRIWRK